MSPLRVVFAGTPAFSLPCLEALLDASDVKVVGVASQPDRPAGRGLRLTASPIKQAALAAGIDTITPDRLRDNAEALDWLRAKDPDVLVVVAFGMILPRPWLDAPRIAPVNVHASLLPRWRGAAPIERALLAGDRETGVCLMRMEQGLDTGPVYACRSIPITDMTTGGELWSELSQLGGTLLADSLPAVAAGRLKPQPQSEDGVTYAAKITGADRSIDWSASAVQVDRQVRCFAPKPGARTRIGERWLKVLGGEPVAASVAKSPGTVLALGAGIDVACSDGVYRIVRVQPEGKGAMDVPDFLRGAQIEPGDRLG